MWMLVETDLWRHHRRGVICRRPRLPRRFSSSLWSFFMTLSAVLSAACFAIVFFLRAGFSKCFYLLYSLSFRYSSRCSFCFFPSCSSILLPVIASNWYRRLFDVLRATASSLFLVIFNPSVDVSRTDVFLSGILLYPWMSSLRDDDDFGLSRKDRVWPYLAHCFAVVLFVAYYIFCLFLVIFLHAGLL